ncbi:D-alanyl-D-alanine carboxypeptidase [Rhizobiales bacterium TNE-4]|nr:D-alanyl-D-alanine carboxypeptidase [Rhizobiales bacterium TNE-4]MBV1827911.1 D-alanyl-D-alanine carboxypeptidase [Rhizobiales bacterium TNE-4]
MERSQPKRALAALALAMTASVAMPAMAGPAIVADIDSGRVLYAEEATKPWHPASVTKLMTVYVALKALAEGKVGLETAIPVSKRASAAPPSKIRLKPGQEITLDNALKIMMVKSANDVAIVIAEGVGGTVENFAAMMNAEAQRLGMTDSHFINPNGLFAAGQQSSARDMAVLARALLTEFPEYAQLFGIGAVKLNDVVMLNTNGLIGRYPGADGMKTGFICASGFNVVATAARGGRKYVAVVFGEPSAQKRTIKASQLFDRAFNGEFSRGPQLAALPRVGGAPPNLREDICVKRIGREPSESDAPAMLTQGTQDDGRPVMMMANGTAYATGPRDEFTPIDVFIGPSSGSKRAPIAANRKTTPTTQTATADAPVKAEPKSSAAKADAKKPAAKKPEKAATKKPAPAKPAKQEPAPTSEPAPAPSATASPAPAAPVKVAPSVENAGGIGISQSGPASFRGAVQPAPSAAPAGGGSGPLILPGAAAPLPSTLTKPAPAAKPDTAKPALKPAADQ